MNIVVAGGAGFLGSHLVDALLERGHFVTVIDSLVTGRYENLADATKRFPHQISFLNRDITHDLYDRRHGDVGYSRKYDAVFNFACPASPVAYQADPIHTMMTCVVGTANLLEFARRDNAVFIHASTSEIYGDPEVHPQREDYKGCVNTTGPRACYDEGKRAAETLCFDYARKHGLRIKVARIFNTYGPRMAVNDGRVVSNFIVQALRGENLTVYGDGSQTRSFCYVDDLIDGFLKLLQTPDEFAGPVNIGNPNEFTIRQLVSKVLAATGFQSNSMFVELVLPQDDPKQRRPDITLAQEVLGWEPKVQLKEGLQRTIEYFREVL